MSDGASSRGTVAWFDIFKYARTASASGSFSMMLPQPHLQPGGGLNGTYKFYFYKGNYRLTTAEVLIEGGSFLTEQTVRATMEKLLNIKTEALTKKISYGHASPIEVQVTLQPLSDPVRAKVYRDAEGNLCGFTRYITSDANGVELYWYQVVPSVNSCTPDYIELSQESVEKMMLYNTSTLLPGTHEVIPFIDVEQNGVPDDLMDLYGEMSHEFTKYYLILPYNRDNGKILVTG